MRYIIRAIAEDLCGWIILVKGNTYTFLIRRPPDMPPFAIATYVVHALGRPGACGVGGKVEGGFTF